MAKREIVSGIPVPEKLGVGRPAVSMAHSLKVGDSVLNYPNILAYTTAATWSKRYPPMQFAARKLPDDVRPDLENRYGVWRVK